MDKKITGGVGQLNCRGAVFPRLRRSDFAAERVREQLHAVTQSEHRQP